MPRTVPITSSLIDALRPQEKDGVLISAIFSTYGLSLDQPKFFDHDFLPTLMGLGGIRDRGYTAPVALERKLKDIYSAIVVDSHALVEQGRPSLQMDVLPVPSKINHAKLVLIHRKRLVRLLVTSANLTHEGYHRSREVAAILDFWPGGSLPPEILLRATDNWLSVLGGVATDQLKNALDAMIETVSRWPIKSNIRNGHSIDVAFGGGPKPLWQQLVEAWPAGEPLLDWWICSPFWPDATDGLTPFETIITGLMSRDVHVSDCNLSILASADSPGDRAMPKFPFKLAERLRDSDFPVRKGQIIPVLRNMLPEEISEGMAGEQRDLHAKWILLRGLRSAVALIGSANFTRKGLGVLNNPLDANIEACVLLKMPASLINPRHWLPPIAKRGIVNWSSFNSTQVKDPPIEEQKTSVWPDFMHRIEMDLLWGEDSEPTGILNLVLEDSPEFDVCMPDEINEESPSAVCTFSVLGDPRKPLALPLGASATRKILVQRCVTIAWGKPRVMVRFPVNISEESKVALPTVLGVRPDEQQLLAYFRGKITDDELIDLLKAVQKSSPGQATQTTQNAEHSRALQNYVVREFVESLFGIEDNLKGAARSPRVFEQALLGEFSVIALAEQILHVFQYRQRTPTATVFQFGELLSLVLRLELPTSDLQETSELEQLRERAISRVLQGVSVAAKRSDFREVCKTTDVQRYLRASLTPTLAKQWSRIIDDQWIIPKETEKPIEDANKS